jgi:hypothetical protein
MWYQFFVPLVVPKNFLYSVSETRIRPWRGAAELDGSLASQLSHLCACTSVRCTSLQYGYMVTATLMSACSVKPAWIKYENNRGVFGAAKDRTGTQMTHCICKLHVAVYPWPELYAVYSKRLTISWVLCAGLCALIYSYKHIYSTRTEISQRHGKWAEIRKEICVWVRLCLSWPLNPFCI